MPFNSWYQRCLSYIRSATLFTICCADHKEFRLGAMSIGVQLSSGEEILSNNDHGLLNCRNLSACNMSHFTQDTPTGSEDISSAI